MTRKSLVRYAWLSIAGAIATISLKALAFWLTGSVGLLSDALESLVNLVAGCAALIALIIAARSADDDHQFGHEKAEYFSSGFEGALILLVLYPANNLFMSAPFVVSLSNHERRSFALRLAQGERQLM
ncbi:MAG: cation diffusion facilitator family transporter [Burkholderiales bacterium]